MVLGTLQATMASNFCLFVAASGSSFNSDPAGAADTATAAGDSYGLASLHRSTIMQVLSGPPIPEGQTYVDAVHPLPMATTVKVASTDVMEAAFRALVEFDPKEHADLLAVEQIYRRIGSSIEVYLNYAMSLAEGVNDQSHWALSFSDGMRAINASLEFLLSPGDEIIVAKPLYGCTDNYFAGTAPLQRGYTIREVDLTDPENLRDVLTSETKVIYFETVTNPNLRVYDLEAIASLAKEINPEVMIIVDNTFPSPAGYNPLLHGADISVHSATKVLGGFTQEMAGVAVVPKEHWKKLFLFRKDTGGVPAPAQIHNLLTRGLPSLYVRFKDMQGNAQHVARYLESSERIEETYYPGLESFAYHENAKRLLRDWDGAFAPGFMISFIPEGKDERDKVAKARKIVDYIARYGNGVITHAVSLGGNKSLIEIPYLGTHATVSDEEKVRWGIGPALIRLSVGMAHSDDQIRLLERAIRYAYS